MKNIITLVLLLTAATASAQWSNTTNRFYDDLHTPVSNVTGTQKNPIVLNSYPDGGYFVIWEDERNIAVTNTDIYAQKYDAAGNALWAANGVPVANGPNAQRYVFSSTQDYRNRSFAATDSAGGFYIGYVDDSINNYSWERIAVQHMRSNGSAVFPGAGYIVEATPAGQNFTYSIPLLIADGNKGFFLSFSKNQYNNDIYVFDYRDENGALKYYGGDRMNDNAIQRSDISPCGVRYYVDYPGTTVQDYNIWPDGQGGCNVIMAINGNTGSQGKMLAFNRMWRAKKASRVKSLFRNTSGVACPRYTDYKKDEVYRLYSLATDQIITTCGTLDGQTIYVVTSTFLRSNGYQLIDEGGYDYNFPKGTTVFPNVSNINVDLIAVTRRTYTNNTVSPFVVNCYAYSAEKYDSVPFQRASFSNPDFGFNFTPSAFSDILTPFRDTILASGNYYPDFSFTSGGTGVGGQHIYASALLSSTGGAKEVRLQHLAVEKQSANTFAVTYKTNTKYGEIIGKEIYTGFSSYNINYDFPLVKVDEYGRAMFYIREYYRSARVSPIRNGAELAWGAMGRPIGTGLYNNSYYNLEQPVVALHPLDGSGIIAWRDNRNIPGNTGENIFMHHLDSLSEFNYAPPYKPVKVVPNPYGGTFANPVYLAGSSKVWSLLEVASTINNVQTTGPLTEIKDDYNLGAVSTVVFQNRYDLRSYNNVPYLDRNYTIKTENTPAGPGLNIGLRLFFTTEEFNTLKLADNAIQNPADLIVIRQPNTTTNIPDAYTPVAGEQVISPTAWKAVPGGYYLELNGNGFGNFFIQKPPAFGTCPGGNATLASAVTGSSYQWQVNTGGGFTNIANGTNYSGANTISLQLNTIPGGWYGYQYRCLVDGAAGSIFFLKFTATWTGAMSTDWNNPANWGCGAVPNANTDVVINSGSVMVNSNSSCRTLTVKPGASVTVKPGVNLDVMK